MLISRIIQTSTICLILIILSPVISCRIFNTPKSDSFEKIKFEKSICLNKCKAYYIDIDNKGAAHLREPGKQERNIDFHLTKKELRDLNKLLSPDKIGSLKDQYDFGDEDTQQKFLTLLRDNKSRIIRFGRDIPDPLKAIETHFDRIVNARNAAK